MKYSGNSKVYGIRYFNVWFYLFAETEMDPIYFNRVTNEKTSVDMALITKIGVFIFNVLKNTVPNYDEIQNDIYYRVKEKFQRLPHLRNGKKLKFEFFSITYSMEQITPIDDCPIAFSVEDVREFIAANKRQEEFSDFDYNAILSAIQEACMQRMTGESWRNAVRRYFQLSCAAMRRRS